MTGSSAVEISVLKAYIVDNSETAVSAYWTVIGDYTDCGAVAKGDFDVTFNITGCENSSVAGTLQKLVLYTEKENAASVPTLTLTDFQINGKSSKPAFDLSKATKIQEWSYDSVKSDDNWSISVNTEGVTPLSADEKYHFGWGGGCIANYQNGEKQVIILNLGTEAGTRDVVYSLEEIYDSMVEAGIEKPEYFKFNWWEDLGSLDNIRLMK